jgi:hypothetical protein
MRFLKTYQSKLSFRVEKPSDVILQFLQKKVRPCSIKGDILQIALKPTFFNVTEGRGFINITVQPNEGGVSTVKAEVIPTSITEEGLYILGGILLIWTIVALLISFSFNSFLTVIAGWIIFTIVMHLMQRLNQGKLENHVIALINEVKHLKVTNIA